MVLISHFVDDYHLHTSGYQGHIYWSGDMFIWDIKHINCWLCDNDNDYCVIFPTSLCSGFILYEYSILDKQKQAPFVCKSNIVLIDLLTDVCHKKYILDMFHICEYFDILCKSALYNECFKLTLFHTACSMFIIWDDNIYRSLLRYLFSFYSECYACLFMARWGCVRNQCYMCIRRHNLTWTSFHETNHNG
jgi:hypothetical protein